MPFETVLWKEHGVEVVRIEWPHASHTPMQDYSAAKSAKFEGVIRVVNGILYEDRPFGMGTRRMHFRAGDSIRFNTSTKHILGNDSGKQTITDHIYVYDVVGK